ncbi:MAG: ABC transporter permease, partial [Thermoplasmata archaeon]
MGARYSLTVRELKKWIRNPANLFISLVQPIFWIILFGSAFDITKLIPSNIPGGSTYVMNSFFMGAKNYISFLTPGMLAIMALFSAMFSGMSIIWDR